MYTCHSNWHQAMAVIPPPSFLWISNLLSISDYFSAQFTELEAMTATEAWMSHIASHEDFQGQQQQPQCAMNCLRSVPDCSFFVIDSTRCHYGEYPVKPQNYSPNPASSNTTAAGFDLHLQPGTQQL